MMSIILNNFYYIVIFYLLCIELTVPTIIIIITLSETCLEIPAIVNSYLNLNKVKTIQLN